MTSPDPSDDPRDLDQQAPRREPVARPQPTRGVPTRVTDPAPAWTQVSTCALVVLVLEVGITAILVLLKLQTIADVLAIKLR